MKRCRSCQQSKANRPRGLCWTCYYREGVREQFPSESKYGQWGASNLKAEPPLAEQPTDAKPGTPGKVEILESRAREGKRLWHPGDARL